MLDIKGTIFTPYISEPIFLHRKTNLNIFLFANDCERNIGYLFHNSYKLQYMPNSKEIRCNACGQKFDSIESLREHERYMIEVKKYKNHQGYDAY
jgi:hypothetical protein